MHNTPVSQAYSAILRAAITFSAGLLIWSAAPLAAQSTLGGFLPNFEVVSTVPHAGTGSGDLNPYGVAFVPPGVNTGKLHPGDILVSNFNNSANLQGTGTTIMDIPIAGGPPTVFFSSTGVPGSHLTGLSTALHVTKEGVVIVGSFPSTDGTCATAMPGSILFINSNGQLLGTLANKYIDGPWDSALIDNGTSGTLFVANGLNGTVSRLTINTSGLQSAITLGSGYMHQCDPATFVDAPTGLVYNSKTDDLYVASTLDNKVFVIHHATTASADQGTGDVLYADNTHLHGALAMAWAPNGDLLVSNNDVINPDPLHPSEIVEFTTGGQFVKEMNVDAAPGGAFGLNVQTVGGLSVFAAVDDNTSSLLIFAVPPSVSPAVMK